MAQVTGALAKYPARASFAWYLTLVIIGTSLLMLPVCESGESAPISLLDAVFTATSAACVTGLSVRSTAHDFSLTGQLFILLLIQVGGIGIMTVTTWVTLQLGRQGTLRQRAVLTETLGADEDADLSSMLRGVIIVSLSIEAVGFVLLAIRNLFDHPPAEALWHALFHSVSAYCNAGFALHDDSLTVYQRDFWVNGVISSLIILGGIGFPVLSDVQRNWRYPWRDLWQRLHIHSKTMILGTTGLILFGMAMFLLLEWDGSLANMPAHEKLLVAAFQSITCRTAGFNTVPISSLTNATLFIMMMLMAIGAGPCSTAGGFKVSTFMLLAYRAAFTFAGEARVNLFRRTIPGKAFDRAIAAAAAFLAVAILALTVILVLEQSATAHVNETGPFLDALFEVVSALGTVGLSTGLTTELSHGGRVVLILLMFIGRLGPISAFAALSRGERAGALEYPQEEPLIG